MSPEPGGVCDVYRAAADVAEVCLRGLAVARACCEGVARSRDRLTEGFW